MNKRNQPDDSATRIVAHVDMDCFFVAVERLKDESLIGKPVVVGGSPEGRGVISSASYEAREFGIHSAMPAARAKKLCPDVIFVRPGFSDYDSYSRRVRAILEEYTPLVEMASIDEAYLDLTGTGRLFGDPYQLAHSIRMQIYEELNLVASFGVGGNKLIAKIASDYGKPDAITYIKPGYEADFLAPMDIRKLPGIGPQTGKKLRSLGINSIGELAQYQEDRLSRSLREKKHAREMLERAHGISHSKVKPERDRKSISKEITFSDDIEDAGYLLSVMHHLSEQVTLKLRSIGQKASTVSIKYRYPDFETHTRAYTLDASTDLNEVVFPVASELFSASAKADRGIRLIGVGVSQLQDAEGQIDLFQEESAPKNSEERTRAVDELRKKYGFDSVVSGQSLNLLRQQNLRKKSDES